MSVKSIVVKVIIGVIIISILVGLIYFLSIPEKEEKQEIISVFSENEEAVQKIELLSENPFSLVKADEKWVMEGMEDIRVNDGYAKSLVKSMCNISSPMLAEENVMNDAKYGFDDGLLVNITFHGGMETVKIGDKSGGFYYVSIEGEDDVYIVNENDLYMVFMDKIDYLDKAAFSVDENTASYIEYSDVVLVKENEDWQEEKPYRHLTDSNMVKTKVVTPLFSIDAVEIVKKADVDLAKETEVYIKAGEEEYRFNVSKGNKGYYIEKESSDYVYRVTDAAVSFTKVTGFDLLAKYVAPVEITEVTEIKMISPEETVVLSIEAPSTQAPFFYKDGKEVTEESFRSFYQILMGLTFKSEGTASGSGEYAVIFTKENGEKLDVRFISADESQYAVSINGKTEFLLLKKSVTDVFDYLKNIEYVK